MLYTLAAHHLQFFQYNIVIIAVPFPRRRAMMNLSFTGGCGRPADDCYTEVKINYSSQKESLADGCDHKS
jgi:hypothetical protein